MDFTPSWTEADEAVEAARMTVREKWQGAVTEYSGFVAIPFVLLKQQAHLDLSATDMVVLFNLLAHWWDPARAVWPRSTTIARRMGVTERTVHRSLDKMVKAGLLVRRRENGRRTFQFTRLAETLASLVGPEVESRD
jgi:DNA-binding MarR family transcriptional regulator